MKRKGYQLLFNGTSEIQQKLMQMCQNNPYVNTIMTENKTKLAQQKTWLKKRKNYLAHKIEVETRRIARTKEKNPKDRSLKGLYSLLSSLQNRLAHLTLKPVVFGTKRLFRKRLREKISRDEFLMCRDASFGCVGKVQGGVQNNNLNPSSPYYQWAQLYDLFKHYGVTPFRSPDPATNLKRNLLVALDTVLDGLNPATGVPPDNLRAGLSACGCG